MFRNIEFKAKMDYYFKTAVHFGCRALQPILAPLEKHYLNRIKGELSNFPPVFIIGSPRTGSTILYQILTSQFESLYINNLTCGFSHNMFFGTVLSQKIFANRTHESYSSRHGETNGWNSPSECGRFWGRWFPKDRHYVESSEIPDKSKLEIRDNIVGAINYHKKPFIFKNLAISLKLPIIHEIFPNAKFVFVRRNPFFTAQSILQAKKRDKLAWDDFWSIRPANYQDLEKLNWSDQIANQIFEIEQQIVKDVYVSGISEVYEIQYEELSLARIHELGLELGFQLKKKRADPVINIKEQVLIPESDEKKLRQAIERINWKELLLKV